MNDCNTGLWIERESALVGGDGLVITPEGLVTYPQTVERIGIGRSETDITLEGRDRFIVLALIGVDVAERVVEVFRLRVHDQPTLDHEQGFVKLLLSEEQP